MKIYHLCPSGAVWIFDEKEVPSREAGEDLFNKVAAEGDVLKIDIPGQDTIKITKLLNIKNPMSKKSQFKTQVNDIQKDRLKRQQEYENRARAFFKEYTELTDKYGIMLDAKIEASPEGIFPKITLSEKTKTINPEPKHENNDKKEDQPISGPGAEAAPVK